MSTLNTAQSSSNPTDVTVSPPSVPAKATPPASKKVTRKPVKKASVKSPRKAAAKKPAPVVKKASPVKAKTTQVASKPAQPKSKEKVKAATEQKMKKPKLVRDSFTFPKDEYQAIAGLKQKALGLNHSVKKSEILRAGLMLLNGLQDKAFISALSKVPALKTGRPAKS